MRSGVYAYTQNDLWREVAVYLYRSEKAYRISSGVATPILELTQFVNSLSITDSSAQLKLAFRKTFFDCDNQPRPGDMLSIVVDGTLRSITIVDQISDFVESRGSRSMSVKGRSRDGFDGWRTVTATSPTFPLGTNYLRIMQVICEQLMALNSSDTNLPLIDYSVPHSNVQFGDMTPWDMLSSVAVASGLEPFVDVLCRVSAFKTDTLRAADISIDNSKLISFGTGRQTNKSGTASVKLAWLDPQLKKQYQVDQVLGNEIITAGFFKLKVVRKVYFSSDRRQRAEDTYMKIVDSCNNGLLGIRVADEDYEQVDPFHGHIVLTTAWWVPTLYTISLGVLLTTSGEPDGVDGPTTVPIGRIAHGVALVTMLGIMMSIGTGTYEVWGQPYDYVHAKNYTVVRGCNLPYHSMNQTDLESNLIMSEAHAQDLMVKYLMYLNASNYEMQVDMVDDPRIEKGDIVLFEDGSRLMVTGFSNEFTRGSSATISVTGMLL